MHVYSLFKFTNLPLKCLNTPDGILPSQKEQSNFSLLGNGKTQFFEF